MGIRCALSSTSQEDANAGDAPRRGLTGRLNVFGAKAEDVRKLNPPPASESVVASTIARVTPPIQSPLTVVDSTAGGNEPGRSVHKGAPTRAGARRSGRSRRSRTAR